MIRKSALYSAGGKVWFLLTVAFAVATYLGFVDPYLPWSTTPGPAWGLPVAILVVGMLGAVLLWVLETRAWVSAGRRADLSADGLGITSKPKLTGDVQGRSVTAYVREEKVRKNSSNRRYTVVEADLGDPAETGLVIFRLDGSGSATDGRGAGSDGPVQAHREGGYGGSGRSEGLVADVLTERVRRALDQVRGLETVHVGAAGDFLSNTGSSAVGSMMASVFTEAFTGDRSSVATETRGVVLDPDQLRARVEAVATVADAFEEAKTDDTL